MDHSTISDGVPRRDPGDDARWTTCDCNGETDRPSRASAAAHGSELATILCGMPRAPLRPPALDPESDDSVSFGGLADVLEPDADAVTSLRQVPAASMRNRAVASAQVQDFAFADTVYADELTDGPPPPSGPIFVQDPMGNTQCMTPLAFRLPMPAEDVDLPTRLRALFARTRHSFRRSLAEMVDLWADTNEMVEPTEPGTGRHLRRAVAMWSFFHWSRTDLTRAALIGLAVFVTAAAIGAGAMDLGGDRSAATSDQVRGQRTLDQHTGRNFVPRSKR